MSTASSTAVSKKKASNAAGSKAPVATKLHGKKPHVTATTEENFILKINLDPDYIKKPSISRTLSVPSTYTFLQLHFAIQVAFEWEDSHAYDFKVLRPINRCGDNEVLLNMSDWSTGGNYEGAGPPSRDVGATVLRDVLNDERYTGMVFLYLYDFGDSWEHRMVVEGIEAKTEYPICLRGAGHPAAEDVGGALGWEAMKALYRKERLVGRMEKERVWRFEHSLGVPLGLGNGRVDFWDRDAVNERLRNWEAEQAEEARQEAEYEAQSPEQHRADWEVMNQEWLNRDESEEMKEYEAMEAQWDAEDSEDSGEGVDSRSIGHRTLREDLRI